jgi:hypothetical protein
MVLEYFLMGFLKGIETGLSETVIEVHAASLRAVVIEQISQKLNLVFVLSLYRMCGNIPLGLVNFEFSYLCCFIFYHFLHCILTSFVIEQSR